MKKIGNVAPMDDAEEDENEGELKDFHRRTFPGGAFIPGSLRATNPRRTDAAIINCLLGYHPPVRTPVAIIQTVNSSALTGDDLAKRRFASFFEETWFPPNQGKHGKDGQEVLVTHIKMGTVFRPKGHYQSDNWAVAILQTGGFLGNPANEALLAEVMEKAQRRTLNLVEKAFIDALATQPRMARPPGARLPLTAFNVQLCDLIRALLQQARWKDATNDDAERIALDVVTLLRTGIYLNWLLMHEQAFEAVKQFRMGQDFAKATPALVFGLNAERRSGTSRSFHQTQLHLDSAFEEGNFAITALSQLHLAMGWEEPHWFDELSGTLGDGKPTAGVVKWLKDYRDAVTAQNVEAYEYQEPETVRQALSEMATAISRNFRQWRPNAFTRFSQRSTIGAMSSMALAEGGALFAALGGNKKQMPLIDLDLYLLVARALMSPTTRMAARIRIDSQLEAIGIATDEATRNAIERELEKSGRMQKLSDAGESLYVRAD